MTDSSNKRDQLLQAATDLFATKGFRGTSIRDIANITSTSLSNIYHYFGSKEGLVLAILERFSREIVTELKRISELDLDPLERFELLVATHIRLAGNSMKESKIFFLDEEHLSPEGQKVNLKIQRDILGAYRRVLGAMNEANLVHSRKLTLTAFNILGVVNWLLRWYRPDGFSVLGRGISGNGVICAERGIGVRHQNAGLERWELRPTNRTGREYDQQVKRGGIGHGFHHRHRHWWHVYRRFFGQRRTGGDGQSADYAS